MHHREELEKQRVCLEREFNSLGEEREQRLSVLEQKLSLLSKTVGEYNLQREEHRAAVEKLKVFVVRRRRRRLASSSCVVVVLRRRRLASSSSCVVVVVVLYRSCLFRRTFE